MSVPLSGTHLAEIRALLGMLRPHADADGAITDLLVEVDRLRAELAEARAKAFRDGADAVMQSSHGEPLRDTYSGLMRACGLLQQLARAAAPTS